jgi:hypothetical protein
MNRKDWPSIAHSWQVARDDVEDPHKSISAAPVLLLAKLIARPTKLKKDIRHLTLQFFRTTVSSKVVPAEAIEHRAGREGPCKDAPRHRPPI